jgi:alpha-glucosidase (family GH31 glycosyl hydrolase)
MQVSQKRVYVRVQTKDTPHSKTHKVSKYRNNALLIRNQIKIQRNKPSTVRTKTHEKKEIVRDHMHGPYSAREKRKSEKDHTVYITYCTTHDLLGQRHSIAL